MDKSSALNTGSGLGVPDGVTAAGQVFDLHALTAVDTAQSAFDHHITVTLNYTTSDISGLDETTLRIYRNDDDEWVPLDNCSINTSAKTVSCETGDFSTFAIFGEENNNSDDSSDDNADTTPIVTTGGGGAVSGPMSVGYVNNATNAVGASTTPYQFKRFLKSGMTGDDVLQLQIFLNSHGFSLATSGKGAPGNETTKFGAKTKASLIKFQEAHSDEILIPQNLPKGTGNFFSYTLKFVNELLRMGR